MVNPERPSPPDTNNFTANYESVPLPESAKEFTLTIGGKTVEQLTHDLQESGIETDSFVEHLFKSKEFKTSKVPHEVSLVRLRVADLGPFDRDRAALTGIYLQRIYDKAKARNLKFVPPEVAPYVALALKDQPVYEDFKQDPTQLKPGKTRQEVETITMGMQPIELFKEHKNEEEVFTYNNHLFYIEHDRYKSEERIFLSGAASEGEHNWPLWNQFIFLK